MRKAFSMLEVMIVVMIIVMTVIPAVQFYSSIKEQTERQATKKVQTETPRSETDQLVDDIQYVKDPRTGLCYAYRWNKEDSHHSYESETFSMTLVPCDKVPKELLAEPTANTGTTHN